MPSSSMVQAVTGLQPNATSFQTPRSFAPNRVLISTMSQCAIGDELTTSAVGLNNGLAYNTANSAYGYMFTIADDFLVQKVFWVNGATASTDNCDVGVFNEAGTTLIVSGGSTLIANINVVQEKDCTDTLLQPGRYWCVISQSGITATPIAAAMTAPLLRAAGCAQMASMNVPIGATFTPAVYTGTNIVVFGIAGRTKVA